VLPALLVALGNLEVVTSAAPPLPVHPHATDVVCDTGARSASVEYDVRETFPAPTITAYLIEALRNERWAVVELGVLTNDGLRSSTLRHVIKLAERGLLTTKLSPPRATFAATDGRTHLWEGRWSNDAGDEITYTISANCPMEQYRMHSTYVHVTGARYDAAEAERRRRERQRRREAFCADLARLNAKLPSDFCEAR
jgi:hypothetical protein